MKTFFSTSFFIVSLIAQVRTIVSSCDSLHLVGSHGAGFKAATLCTLNFTSFDQNCTNIDDITNIDDLTLDDCNQFYLVSNDTTSNSLFTFSASDPTSLTLITTYTNPVHFITGITFVYEDGSIFSSESSLFGIGAGGVNGSQTSIYKVNLDQSGTLTEFVTFEACSNVISPFRAYSIAYSPYDGYIYTFVCSFDSNFNDSHTNETIYYDLVQINPQTANVTVANSEISFERIGIYLNVRALAVLDYNYLLLIDFDNQLWMFNIYNKSDVTNLELSSLFLNDTDYLDIEYTGLICADINQNDRGNLFCNDSKCFLFLFVWIFNELI